MVLVVLLQLRVNACLVSYVKAHDSRVPLSRLERASFIKVTRVCDSNMVSRFVTDKRAASGSRIYQLPVLLYYRRTEISGSDARREMGEPSVPHSWHCPTTFNVTPLHKYILRRGKKRKTLKRSICWKKNRFSIKQGLKKK